MLDCQEELRFHADDASKSKGNTESEPRDEIEQNLTK
jgi:hypothetical protein